MTKRIQILAGMLALALSACVQSISAQKAQDDFAGSGATSSAWTVLRSGLSRSNGMLVSQSSFGVLRRNDIAVGAAQYSQGVWGVASSNIFNGQSHLFVRMADVDNYYWANLDDGRHNVTISRRVGGNNYTLFSTYVPAAFAKGDTIKLSIDNAFLLTVSRNGVPFGSFNDAASGRLASGGVGIGLSGLSTYQAAWDYWDGGSQTAGCALPVVTVDPRNANVIEPGTAGFTVAASGATSFQWQRATSNVVNGNGANAATYTTATTSVMYDNGSTYRAIVRNSCGADTSASAMLTVSGPAALPIIAPTPPMSPALPTPPPGNGTPTVGLPFSDDFESADSACWASRPNGDENSKGCGGLTNIGKGGASDIINRSGRFGVAHSGSRTARIVYTRNEDESRMRRNHINSDSVFARFWVYFDPNYDHAFGEKFFRANSIDSATGTLYWDMIFYLRNSTQTSGKDNMASITGEPNGGSGSFGTANISFPRGVWFEVAFKIRMNTPGGHDGEVSIWYNDAMILNSKGLSNMRTSSRGNGYNHLTDNHKITSISYGGWYSNGSGGAPNVPAVKYLDDLCADVVKCPSLVPR
ncbi:MAG: polysaccharide lyase [Fibrobacteria bacterium]